MCTHTCVRARACVYVCMFARVLAKECVYVCVCVCACVCMFTTRSTHCTCMNMSFIIFRPAKANWFPYNVHQSIVNLFAASRALPIGKSILSYLSISSLNDQPPLFTFLSIFSPSPSLFLSFPLSFIYLH